MKAYLLLKIFYSESLNENVWREAILSGESQLNETQKA